MSELILGWDRPDEVTQQVGFATTQSQMTADLNTGGSLIADGTEGHALLVAATGSGKSRNFAIPNILHWQGGLIAVDIKGELLQATHRERAKLGKVVALDPFRLMTRGNQAFNPLEKIDPASPGFFDDVLALAELLDGDSGTTGLRDGDFWRNWAVDVTAAVIADVMSRPGEGNRSLAEAAAVLQSGDLVYDLCVRLDKGVKPAVAAEKMKAFVNLVENTRSGVAATVGQHSRLLGAPQMQQVLRRTSFSTKDLIAGEPLSIYIIWPPEKLRSHGAVLRMILQGLVQLLFRRRRKPRTPTLILADEATQIGRVSALVSATTLGRGFGIRIAWIMQSVAQLRDAYPHSWQSIVDNCGVAMTMGPQSRPSMSQDLAATLFSDRTAEEIFGLGRDQALIQRAGEPSRVLKKLDYLSDDMFRGRYDQNRMYAPRQAG